MLYKTLLFTCIFSFFLSFPHLYAYADSMGNSEYLLRLNTINTANQNTQPIKTINQPLRPAYNVQSGFLASNPLNPFTFSMSSDLIDFGILSATNPISRTSTITISNAPMGYEVLGSENHQLQTGNVQFIPDTTCDDGTPCSETIPGTWASVTTFGFGYHCENLNNFICDNTSSDSSLYKHFADTLVGQEPQQIVQSINNANKTSQATITYKVNISGNQQNGLYSNEVTYLAVPNY
jgi:hypothetical protein